MRCLPYTSLFSSVLSFKHLLRYLDLTMIAWLSTLTTKFFWLNQNAFTCNRDEISSQDETRWNRRNIIWNLPWFATTLLILNQLRIKCVSLDNFRVPSSKSGEHEYIVVSSAKLQISVSWLKNIKSFIKSLNDIGPRIEPCGTPFNIYR